MKTINTMPVLSFKITGIIVILLMWTSSFTQAKTNNSTDCFYVDRMSTTMSDKNDMKQKLLFIKYLQDYLEIHVLIVSLMVQL